MTYTISDDELRLDLEQVLSQCYEQRRKIVSLMRQPSAYRMSFLIEELTVGLDDGSELNLIFKDLSWRSLTEKARQEKPPFLYNPRREIEIYQKILAHHQMGQAVYYGAIVDEVRDRYWLFLEDVPGLELYQVGEFDLWEGAARWLAGLHADFAANINQLARAVPLLHYDREFCWQWLDRARTFVLRREADMLPEVRNHLTWLAERYDHVVGVLSTLPTTFIHGEFYASNVLVEQLSTGLRVSPVDWEMSGVGPGVLDLAALTVGNWTEDEKTAMAIAYFNAQPTNDRPYETLQALLTALDYAHLYVSILWLGWTPEWAPPNQTGLNWLGEAMRLAEKLDL